MVPENSGNVSQEDLDLLQQAQDAYSRVTIAITKIGMDILKTPDLTDAHKAIVKDAMDQRKKVVPITEKIDDLQTRVVMDRGFN